MKATCWVPALTLLLVGCNDSAKPPGTSSSNPATAPADYLKEITTSEKRATKIVDVSVLNRTIENFYVQEGRFPKSLQELVDLKYLPLLPPLPEGVSWNYDTNLGAVSIEKR